MHTTAQIKEIIKGHSVREIESIIDDYIHSSRNRELAKRTILSGEKYEPLSEEYELTPRQVANIVKAARMIILEHIET